MSARGKGRTAPPLITVSPGDLVLIGSRRITMPAHWFIARVEWSDGEDVLVTQWGVGGAGKGFRNLHAIEAVRAVGTIPFLNEFKRASVAWVRDRELRVRALEQALGQARDAVWNKLDEIGATVVQRAASGGEAGPA